MPVSVVLVFLLTVSAISVVNGHGGIVCPDGTKCIDDEHTCCAIDEHDHYGCCQLPNAVCCADRAHCCPETTICDLKRQRCVPELLMQKTAIKSHSSWDMGSPTHKQFYKLMYLIYNRNTNTEKNSCSGCPGGSTCCNGDGNCCPLPNAVCCSDGIHCCPQNMKCDETGQTCITKEDLNTGLLITESAAEEIVFQKTIEWTNIKSTVTDIVCPDGQTRCLDDNTCCDLEGGGYGCCPYPNATCCNDGRHCCPAKMKCDLAHSRCVQSDNLISFPFQNNTKTNAICPDKQTRCPDETTCCQLASGGYGCCPFPEALCCSDKLHCCPHGYQCDLTTMSCKKGAVEFEVASILPGERILESNSVVCPGGHFKCPDNTTCCELPSGKYGCCPYPRAVCCLDKEHCCPEGTTCDIPHQRCIQGSFDIPLAQVLLAEKIKKED